MLSLRSSFSSAREPSKACRPVLPRFPPGCGDARDVALRDLRDVVWPSPPSSRGLPHFLTILAMMARENSSMNSSPWVWTGPVVTASAAAVAAPRWRSPAEPCAWAAR